MKFAIRIFNIVIMAFSLAATVLLFATPTFTFNSKIAVDVAAFSKFVPETEYTKDVDIVKLIGTDTINLRIKFALDNDGISKAMSGDKDKINEMVITENVNEIVQTLHTPVDLITDFTIRSIIQSTIKAEIAKQIDVAKEGRSDSTAEEIMDDVGMTDQYFQDFSFLLYDTANRDDATVDMVSNILFDQIDEALEKAGDYVNNDQSAVEEYYAKREQIKTNLASVLNDLNLVKDDGSLKKISTISYSYLAKYLKDGLAGKVAEEELEQKVDETEPEYSDRLLNLFVTTNMPDAFYQAVSYVSLGLFIGLFVFAGIWLLLFLITLLKTISKKPWTIFGPWFWIIGSLQLVLGLGLTIFGKFIFPTIPFGSIGIPLSQVILAPRTYALIPSIMFLISILMAIAYLFFKVPAKRQYKREKEGK